MKLLQQDLMAFDGLTASNREIDQDGHLHIKVTPISKATVNMYYGREIPGARELGLAADGKYNLLRDPEELAKGAATFNGKPLLIIHRPQFAHDHQKSAVVGTAGHSAFFEDPYLNIREMTVWAGDSIAEINMNKRRELSCSYRYKPDMTPGVYNGMAYDGVMRNIYGNHVCLVPDGRAGSDVLVADSMPVSRQFYIPAHQFSTPRRPSLRQFV